MSLVHLLNEAQGGQGLAALAARFGIDEAQAGELAGLLAPAIGTATRRRAEAGGIDRVAGQLKGERAATFFDDAARAAEPEGQAQGQRFLDEIFGAREASDRLSHAAAERTGIDASVVGQVLPAIAAMLQGGMQRRMPDSTLDDMLGQFAGAGHGGSRGGGLLGMVLGALGGRGRGSAAPQGGQGSALGPLVSMLDRDGDGSAFDDILDAFLRR